MEAAIFYKKRRSLLYRLNKLKLIKYKIINLYKIILRTEFLDIFIYGNRIYCNKIMLKNIININNVSISNKYNVKIIIALYFRVTLLR